MLVAPVPGSELRIQVDERTERVQSVLLAGAEGALELRAFAAPRNGDLWSEVRPQIAADMARRGGTATEQEGRFGPELVCQLSVKTPDGRTGQRPPGSSASTARAGCCGRRSSASPAVDPERRRSWEDALTRSPYAGATQAMPVGDPLPLTLPEEARRVSGRRRPRRTPPQDA